MDSIDDDGLDIEPFLRRDQGPPDPEELRRALAPLLDIIRRAEAPGAAFEYLKLIRAPDDMPTLGRVADRIARGWLPIGPVGLALARLASERGETRQEAKRDAAIVGLLLALSHHHEPQTMRFGARWLKDRGPRAKLPPSKLPIPEASGVSNWQWLRSEAIGQAEAWLLDYIESKEQAGSKGETLPLEQERPRRPDDHDAILEHVARHLGVRESYAAILATLSPRERELLEAMRALGEVNLTAAADLLGIQPNAARQRWLQVRRKVPKKFPPDT